MPKLFVAPPAPYLAIAMAVSNKDSPDDCALARYFLIAAGYTKTADDYIIPIHPTAE